MLIAILFYNGFNLINQTLQSAIYSFIILLKQKSLPNFYGFQLYIFAVLIYKVLSHFNTIYLTIRNS